ncbi:MAG: helix-turn-helix transcriptional regulator [Lachnospiraceae bacterium]|nr:helix-turn-helix transcriptional regulator [Lachnospiraceae bacterium]
MKNLLLLRRKAGLTQQALADSFHLSQQTIYKYENGHAEPDIETLKQFARFFGVTVDYLIGNDETTEEVQMDYTSDEKLMIAKVRRLSPDIRSALNGFIDNLTKNKERS